MRVLVACEFSGIVRRAFAARGHDAWSCDLPAEDRSNKHIVGDARSLLNDGWDLLIVAPPRLKVTLQAITLMALLLCAVGNAFAHDWGSAAPV
jgi:hypothetical protein